MNKTSSKQSTSVDRVTIRFAGDSGDGIQLVGERFTTTSAMMGQEVATFTDFPAEIRAPAGSPGGVSGFQLTFGAQDVYTAGDQLDALFAMNPAALKVNVSRLKENGLLIINKDGFTQKNLEKAGYKENPCDTGAFSKFKVYQANITTMTKSSLEGSSLKGSEAERCKNFFALGVSFYLYERDLEPTLDWIDRRFKKDPDLAEANKRALRGGYNFAASTEMFPNTYHLESKESKEKGVFRNVTGNKALALGLIVAAKKANLSLYLASYPITPATEVLQELSALKHFGVTTFQAEDEIAAVGAAIGASFGGVLAATSTSGPGFALKSEAINLAVMAELPLVVIDVQRAGPSTGMPTKTEQADLLQALWGRNGESPLVVLAAQSPSDCFEIAFEAARIAISHMTPVIVLSDSSLASGSQVFKVPDLKQLPEIHPLMIKQSMEDFKPYERHPELLVRPWVVPGTPGGTHRIGGLEKENVTGCVSVDPENHQKMVEIRAKKIEMVAKSYPKQTLYGDPKGKLLVVGWGSTYGTLRRVVQKMYKQGHPIAFTHLRYINPLPMDLPAMMNSFPKVVVPENNMGQLWMRLGSVSNKPLHKFNRITGTPFQELEMERKLLNLLEEK